MVDIGPKWEKNTLRVAVASMIVGAIYNQPNAMVGDVTRASRRRGLDKADKIIRMVREHDGQKRTDLKSEAGSNDQGASKGPL